MWYFGAGAIGILMFALWIFCVFDVITTDESDCRHLPKMVWLLIVLFIPTVGSIAWLVVGRARGAQPRVRSQGSVPSRRFPEYERPGRHIAANPDDDEEFLRRCRARAEEQRRAAKRKRAQEEDGAGAG